MPDAMSIGDGDTGLVLPRDRDGKRSSIALGRAVFADALRAANAEAAAAIEHETHWHQRYPGHVRRLVEAGARSAAAATAIARAGIDSLHQRLAYAKDGTEQPLAAAMANPPENWQVATLRGRGDELPAAVEVPYRGARLSDDPLLRQLDAWVHVGTIEPSHADQVRWVMDRPEALDLSDQRIALLGARAEMGPLPWLSRWRAQIVAVDLPTPALWHDIVHTVQHGNATLYAPMRAGSPKDADSMAAHAGADLLLDLPGIAAWLCESDRPLTVGAYAYLDGALHVRVAAAMDAIQAAVCAKRPDTTLAMLATPTDIYAVPAMVREAAHHRHAQRSASAALLSALSGGRLFRRNVEACVQRDDGSEVGIADSMVVQQGPNYALAKRLQQWRASVARAAGFRVSIHVAPPATTVSVIKNRLLANAYRAARHFGVEAFDPRTASALMATLLVHDLRNPSAKANADIALAHPLDLFADGAAHGGLWRMPHAPNSVLPLAAVLGSLGMA